MVLQTENLNKELYKTLIVAFEEIVNLDNDSTITDKAWNGIKRMSQQCLRDSSAGHCVQKGQLLESFEIQI
jgi:hypothetical protein